MRETLKNKKNITIIGRYMAVDWDGWNSRPTYLIANVHIFNKDGELIDSVDHLWFLSDEELYTLEEIATNIKKQATLWTTVLNQRLAF